MSESTSPSSAFIPALLGWYAQHARPLPWRALRNPYYIWVSEIMLQQTRVETVIPYFQRWISAFPTVEDLANADIQQVLLLWEGLGYYARARNLYKAAQLLVTRHAGQLPRDVATLQSLPGIGRYTAGAIASIAYGQDTAVLDGNVKRIFARLFHLEALINTLAGEAELWKLADALVPAGRASEYNQALMDLGATICLPQNPQCLLCPVRENCLAWRVGAQGSLPRVQEKSPTPHYHVAAGVIWRDGRLLLAQRPADKLLGSLWEFPGGKQEMGETLPACLQREIREELACEITVAELLISVPHAFTHFRITVHAFESDWQSGEPQALQCADWRWVLPSELGNFPMGKVDRVIARLVQERLNLPPAEQNPPNSC